MSNLRPTFCVESVRDITPEVLISHDLWDIEGVTFDVDKTLVGQHEYTVDPDNLATLARLSEVGYAIGLVSNAPTPERTERVKQVGRSIGELIGAEVKVITSRMVDGKSKPQRPMFDRMSSMLGIESGRLVHVGDQLLKDVLGANRAGYAGSVLVAPYGEGDHAGVRYVQRPFEALIRPMIGLPLRTSNFPRRNV